MRSTVFFNFLDFYPNTPALSVTRFGDYAIYICKIAKDFGDFFVFLHKDTSFKNFMYMYSRDLNTELELGIWMVEKRLDVKWTVIWMPYHYRRDSPTIWITNQWMPSCFLINWSGIWMVSIVHRLTIWNLKFKKFGIQNIPFGR